MNNSRNIGKRTNSKSKLSARNTRDFDDKYFMAIEMRLNYLEKFQKIQYMESMISSLAHMANESGEPFIAQILRMAQIEAKDNKNKLESLSETSLA